MNQLDLHYIFFVLFVKCVFCWSRYVVVIDMDLGIWRSLWLVYLMILLVFTFSPFFFRFFFANFFIWSISLDWIIDFNSFRWLLIFHFLLKCTGYLVISFFYFSSSFIYVFFFLRRVLNYFSLVVSFTMGSL